MSIGKAAKTKMICPIEDVSFAPADVAFPQVIKVKHVPFGIRRWINFHVRREASSS